MYLNEPRAQRLMQAAGVDALVAGTRPNVFYMTGYMSDVFLGSFYDCMAVAVYPRSAGARPDLVVEADPIPLISAAKQHAHVGQVIPSSEVGARDYGYICQRCGQKWQCWGEPAVIVGERDVPYLADSPTWVRHIRTYDRIGFYAMSEAAYKLDTDANGQAMTPLQKAIKVLDVNTRGVFSKNVVEAAARTIQDAGLANGTLAFDNLRLAKRIQEQFLPDLKWVDGYDLFRQIRMVKTAEEIAVMRQSAAINERAIQAAASVAREGVHWTDVIREYKVSVARDGGKWQGEWGLLFGPAHMSAVGLNDKDYVLKAGDAIVFDVLAAYKQYCTDMARTAVIGEPTSRQRRLFDAVRTTHEAVFGLARDGANTGELRRQLLDILGKAGGDPAVCIILPHCIGIEIFEFPESYGGEVNDFVLEENMTINVEVLQIAPDDGGAFHLEETLVVGKDGCQSLATSPTDLMVLPTASLVGS